MRMTNQPANSTDRESRGRRPISNWAQIITAVCSLFVAGISVYYSHGAGEKSQKAISIAEQNNSICQRATDLSAVANKHAEAAIEISREAKNLAERQYRRNAGSIVPTINVGPFEKEITLVNKQDLEKANIGIHVTNVGREPIDQLRADIYTTLVTRATDIAHIETHHAPFYTYRIKTLAVILQANRATRMDLAEPILGQLVRIYKALDYGNQNLEVFFNVVCSARIVGQELPSVTANGKVPQEERSSWLDAISSVDIIIKWDPNSIDQETIENQLKKYIVPAYIDGH